MALVVPGLPPARDGRAAAVDRHVVPNIYAEPGPGRSSAHAIERRPRQLRTAQRLPRPRILVADDDVRFRVAVRDILTTRLGATVAEASDALEAVSVALRVHPAVCLIEVHLAGGGIGAAREISSRLGACRVIVMTSCEDRGHILSSFRAGAAGYFRKAENVAWLPRAVAAVISGEVILPRALTAELVAFLRERSPKWRTMVDSDFSVAMTAREWEVLQLLRAGSPTHRIAALLNISESTVRTHIQGALRKAGVQRRSELDQAPMFVSSRAEEVLWSAMLTGRPDGLPSSTVSRGGS